MEENRGATTFGAGRLRAKRYHKNCDNVAGSTRRGVSSPFPRFRGLAVQTTRGRKPSFFVWSPIRAIRCFCPHLPFVGRTWRFTGFQSGSLGAPLLQSSAVSSRDFFAALSERARSGRFCSNLRLDPSIFLPKDQGNRRAEKNRRGIADKAI